MGESYVYITGTSDRQGDRMEDLQAILPDGSEFDFWEQKTQWKREWIVDAKASEDGADGTAAHPFPRIQQAASLAEPGDRVRIHAGVYREWVHPERGGTDPRHMISYEAFGDGKVEIRASEQVKSFRKSTGWRLASNPFASTEPAQMRVYEYDLDPDLFRGYNPFGMVNILHDRLFLEYDKTDMTPFLERRGRIFCDGMPLRQVALYNQMSEGDGTYWVEANGMKVHFRLPGDADPKNHKIEVTVREQCFAPAEPFLSYIRVKGLTLLHAATGAPVPQRGALSAFRGHHWIIEDCTVDWPGCVGVDVGDECWHHEHEPGRLTGYSVVRRCRILHAGVCGLAGLFARHMLVEDCLFEGTGWQKMELSWEAGAVKFHNSVNGLIRRNVFLNTFRADSIWLDCGNENNRITGNLFLNGREQREAIFIECTRDEVNLIDNNIIWNVEGRFDPSKIPAEPGSSGWYKLVENDAVNGYGIYGEGTDHLYIAHNLIGLCRGSGYYEKPVAFRQSGIDRGGTSRDAHIRNNIFYQCGNAAITFPTRDNDSDGNLFVNMSGGYLRVMYPEPELCLHLPAWKEFLGFDLHSQEAFLQVQLQEETDELSGSSNAALGKAKSNESAAGILFSTGQTPFGLPEEIRRRHFVYRPEDISRVEADAHVKCDFLGQRREEGGVMPGPFQMLRSGKRYQIDPRRAE